MSGYYEYSLKPDSKWASLQPGHPSRTRKSNKPTLRWVGRKRLYDHGRLEMSSWNKGFLECEPLLVKTPWQKGPDGKWRRWVFMGDKETETETHRIEVRGARVDS